MEGAEAYAPECFKNEYEGENKTIVLLINEKASLRRKRWCYSEEIELHLDLDDEHILQEIRMISDLMGKSEFPKERYEYFLDVSEDQLRNITEDELRKMFNFD